MGKHCIPAAGQRCRKESTVSVEANQTSLPRRGTCLDSVGATRSWQAWLGGATLWAPMHLHWRRKHLRTNTGMPGLFRSNWSPPSTSDYIGGDDIIVENSCRSKAASWDNVSCLVWWVLMLETDWLTEMHFSSVAIACTTHCILALLASASLLALWWFQVNSEKLEFIGK